jgi:hypothetical protein
MSGIDLWHCSAQRETAMSPFRLAWLARALVIAGLVPQSVIVAAQRTRPHDGCAEAILGAYNYLTFAGNYTGPDYCQNQLKVDSINAAFRVYCLEADLEASVVHLDTLCQHQVAPISEWVYDPAEVTKLRVVEFGEYRRKFDKVPVAVMISAAFYDRSYRTLV